MSVLQTLSPLLEIRTTAVLSVMIEMLSDLEEFQLPLDTVFYVLFESTRGILTPQAN